MTTVIVIWLSFIILAALVVAYSLCKVAADADRAQDAIRRKREGER
jgi:hypothetical protein